MLSSVWYVSHFKQSTDASPSPDRLSAENNILEGTELAEMINISDECVSGGSEPRTGKFVKASRETSLRSNTHLFMEITETILELLIRVSVSPRHPS